jgi:hypothetical protein
MQNQRKVVLDPGRGESLFVQPTPRPGGPGPNRCPLLSVGTVLNDFKACWEAVKFYGLGQRR